MPQVREALATESRGYRCSGGEKVRTHCWVPTVHSRSLCLRSVISRTSVCLHRFGVCLWEANNNKMEPLKQNSSNGQGDEEMRQTLSFPSLLPFSPSFCPHLLPLPLPFSPSSFLTCSSLPAYLSLSHL